MKSQKSKSLINEKNPEINGNEWLEILKSAIESKCEKKNIDNIFSNIIICLKNCNDSEFINKSAEKLPDLIKYISFMLVPIPIMSKLFESRYACLPCQIELANFIIKFLDVVGVPGISFVHYLDSKRLPQFQIDILNQKFKEFDCSHLFPDFQIHSPHSYELKDLTIQCQIVKNQSDSFKEKLNKLERNHTTVKERIDDSIQNDEQKMKEYKNEVTKSGRIYEVANKIAILKNQNEELKKKIDEIIEKNKKIGDKQKEKEEIQKEYIARRDLIRKYYFELKNVNINEMKVEIDEMNSLIEKFTPVVEQNEKIAEQSKSILENLKKIEEKMSKPAPDVKEAGEKDKKKGT